MVSEHEEKELVFVGEALALDLINTVVVIRGKQYDWLETPDDLAFWWEEARQRYPEIDKVRGTLPAYDIDLVHSVKMLRDGLRQLFISVIQGHQPEEGETQMLNGVLRMGYPALQWQTGELPEAVYGLHGSTENILLFPVALSAQHLLTEADLNRLHQCHNQRCIILFYDTTKSGTRQWCSTACFDRERSLQRYQQRKRT